MKSEAEAGEAYVSPASWLLRLADPEDQDDGDIAPGTNADHLDDDDLDTDRLISDEEQVPGPPAPAVLERLQPRL